LEKIDLRHLKTLELYQCTLDATFFEALFSSLTSLTKWRIASSICKEEAIDYQKLEAVDVLGNLQELSICNSCLPNRFVEVIFEKAHRLESIQLIGTPDLAAIRPRSTSQNVQEIEFHNSHISLPFLEQLLSSAPQLRKILLISCQNLAGSFVQELALDALTHLSLGSNGTSSNLSAAALTQIVKQAPNIQKLRFGFEPIEPIELASLKDLDMCGSKIHLKNFLKLLEQAPNLEELDVAYCENLRGTLDEEMLERVDTQRLIRVRHSWLPTSILNRFRTCSPKVDIRSTHREIQRSAPREIEDPEIEYMAPFYSVSFSSDGASKLHAKRIFEGKGGDHPDVRFYRLSVFDSLSTASLPFVWSQSKKVKLTACSDPPIWTKTKKELDLAWDCARQEGYRFYLATYDMPAEKKWLPLPSYLSDELITHIYADGEILYSESENLYYFKLNSGDKKIYYIIKVPEPLPITVLDSDIVGRIRHYKNSFRPEELDLKKVTTPEEFYREIARQKCGACRHRVAAFFHELRQQFGQIEARLEKSEIHDFIAIKHKSRWVRCDLGGSASGLSIDERDHTLLSQKALHITDQASKNSIKDYCFKQILRPGKKTLIQVNSKQDLDHCRKLIPYMPGLHLVDASAFDVEEMALFVEKRFTLSECVVGFYILGGYSFADKTQKFTDFWHETVTITFEAKTNDPLVLR
ncbi:MAG: hypothetical protein JSS12_11290, partial [Verrucomicrobia bacterium]|nr:hypothetical protein [Verrucomicrobiota bacterium]